MSSLDVFVLKFIATRSFFFCLISLGGFCMLPAAYKSYLKWKITQNQNDFSNILVLAFGALLFFSSAYPIFLFTVIKIHSMPIFSSGINSLLLFALPCVTLIFSYSMSVKYYKILKIKKTAGNFSLLCFFGMILFYSVSVYFIFLLHTVILWVDV